MKKISGLILLFIIPILLFCLSGTTKASGASLSLSPQNGTFTQGSTFDVSIFLNTAKNPVNAVSLKVLFDPQKLQVVTPAKGLSVVSNWVYPPNFSNTNGTVSLQGGFPQGGINTSQGLITIITFKAMATGNTTINFSTSSLVLVNNAQGTNILNSTNQSVIDIIAAPPAGPQIFSPTNPDQNVWYKNSDLSFSWQPVEGANVGYSYQIDDDPYGEPPNTINTTSTSITLQNVPEGIEYFHLKAQTNQIWGGTSNYKIMIDRTPPEAFKLNLEPFGSVNGKYLSIYFNTNDLMSGIDHYEAKLENVTNPQNIVSSAWEETQSPYQLSSTNAGTFNVMVRAFDKAGNFQESDIKVKIINSSLIIANGGMIISGIFVPQWLAYLFTIIIFFVIAFLLYLLLRWLNKRAENPEVNLYKEIQEAEKEIADVKQTEEKLRKLRLEEEGAEREYEKLKTSLDDEIKKNQ